MSLRLTRARHAQQSSGPGPTPAELGASTASLALRQAQGRGRALPDAFLAQGYSTVDEWLAQSKLQRYAASIKHVGYDELARPFRVSICAARTLNATGQCRVTLLSRW